MLHSWRLNPSDFFFRPPTYEGHIRPKLQKSSTQVQQIGCDKWSHDHGYYGIAYIVKGRKERLDAITDSHHPFVSIFELLPSLPTLTGSRTGLGHGGHRVGGSTELPALCLDRKRSSDNRNGADKIRSSQCLGGNLEEAPRRMNSETRKIRARHKFELRLRIGLDIVGPTSLVQRWSMMVSYVSC
jgi:hypothetical protein